ncbi:MAG TPA: hypothetical protein PLM07_09375 [Candidatus Rifleibacterium sp.]|nr:hypothetical protein [Candidatus Rifleibacterium sp.]HPT46098.1 hypothetical protein [Candidatus Rifleibacterium sp.]
MKSPAKHKILILCLYFWAFTLLLGAGFRIRTWQILTADQRPARAPVAVNAIRPTATTAVVSEKPAVLLKQWQDWRKTPTNWGQKTKEEFFARHCQDLIKSAGATEVPGGSGLQ